MRYASGMRILAVLSLLAFPVAAHAQDVVVMRRTIAAPVPKWFSGEWGAWSSTCSKTATRSRTVSCSGGTCQGTEPEATQSAWITSDCTYTATNGTWGACESTGVRRRSVTCTRADGESAPASACNTTDVETEPCAYKATTTCPDLSTGREKGVTDSWTLVETVVGKWPAMNTTDARAAAKAYCEQNDDPDMFACVLYYRQDDSWVAARKSLYGPSGRAFIQTVNGGDNPAVACTVK
jgi:hypothetical protein